MKLNTHPENRKDMVKAISELLELPSAYMGMPSAAFQIGTMTINRDGTIDCEDETMIETVKPMLIECGWLEAEKDSEVSAAPEDPADSKEITEDTEPIRVAQMDLTIPIENWTVAQMTNLVRMLYSKQYLINRMLDYGMLSIEESFITAISENPPETAADFEERILKAIEGDCICGFRIADGKAALSVPFAEDEPTRWTAYADLLKGILKTAETASRISIKRLDDSENEKYHANSWLMRMGFGGADYKETRRILMGHLTGFAAFKSAADMEAHKKRQAQRRRERREEGQHEQPEQLKALREQYPKGCRVELVHMNDPYRPDLKAGALGTVLHVDDIGTIHVSWDCGSSLGVVLGEDSCTRIDEEHAHD